MVNLDCSMTCRVVIPHFSDTGRSEEWCLIFTFWTLPEGRFSADIQAIKHQDLGIPEFDSLLVFQNLSTEKTYTQFLRC